jgi:TetR/AcrR family tetracycline transcriptional repressor
LSVTKRRGGRPRKGEGGVDRAKIVETAWAIVNANGLAGLSTRTLAAALEVKSPALYWHVSSKQELLSLMVEHLLQNSISDNAGRDWREWFKSVGRRQRQLLLSHRDAGLIASIAPPTERIRTELFPRLFHPLIEAGLTEQQATAAAGGLASVVLGWVIYEQRPDTQAMIEAFHDPDEAFELVLTSFVLGLDCVQSLDRERKCLAP